MIVLHLPILVFASVLLLGLLSIHFSGQQIRNGEMSGIEIAIRMVEKLDKSVNLDRYQKDEITWILLDTSERMRKISESNNYSIIEKKQKTDAIERERDARIKEILEEHQREHFK